jgi:hypothetical protein
MKTLIFSLLFTNTASAHHPHCPKTEIMCDTMSSCVKSVDVCKSGTFRVALVEDRICVLSNGEVLQYQRTVTEDLSYRSNESCAESRIEYLQKNQTCL